MWNSNQAGPDSAGKAAEDQDKPVDPETEKAASGKKSTSKSSRSRKTKSKTETADTTTDKTAKQPTGDKKPDSDSAQQPAMAEDHKATEAAVAAEVKLPGSSFEVTTSAQADSQPSGKTVAAAADAGNNNIISLAQRIRALHGDVSGNS